MTHPALMRLGSRDSNRASESFRINTLMRFNVSSSSDRFRLIQ